MAAGCGGLAAANTRQLRLLRHHETCQDRETASNANILGVSRRVTERLSLTDLFRFTKKLQGRLISLHDSIYKQWRL